MVLLLVVLLCVDGTVEEERAGALEGVGCIWVVSLAFWVFVVGVLLCVHHRVGCILFFVHSIGSRVGVGL